MPLLIMIHRLSMHQILELMKTWVFLERKVANLQLAERKCILGSITKKRRCDSMCVVLISPQRCCLTLQKFYLQRQIPLCIHMFLGSHLSLTPDFLLAQLLE